MSVSESGGRTVLRSRTVRGALAGVAILAVAGPAAAGDGGNFFEQLFGVGRQQAAPQPQYEPEAVPEDGAPYQQRASRPLTVKLHRPKVKVAQVPTKPSGPVSIYEDATLRRGDAVMTKKGLRIFVGGNRLPYSDDDFVALAEAGRMDKGMRKTLVALDSLPRQ